MVRRERFLYYLALACSQVNAKLVSQGDKLTAGMPVTFGILIDELFDAHRCFGKDPLLVTLLQPHFFIERTLDQQFEVWRDGGHFALGPFWISTLAWLPLKLSRRAARPDLVLLS